MSMPTFFFDTADTDYINKTWNKLKDYVDGEGVIGITTNPSALSKVNCDTLTKFEELVPRLCDTVAQIRGNDSTRGIVYVQVPNSTMSENDIIRWATYVNKFNENSSAIVALKIPHFSYALRLASHPELRKLYLNVTGVSDAGTIIRALSYSDVFFASIIPGRMEETGINANEHLEYLANHQLQRHQNIIAGSMRTIAGLKNSIYYHTVPTIGTRVWDIISEENLWEEFPSYWENTYKVSNEPVKDFMPENTVENIKLSQEFFTQMDILGNTLNNEFCGELVQCPDRKPQV